MCGLTGIFSPRGLSPGASHTVGRMADALRHRGPDDHGAWVDVEAGVAFGHRRLAVLELSAAGRQPMRSSCGRYVIVLNGEIYDHLDLRSELQAIGESPPWRGRSDTETLLACVTRWGIVPTLQRASGMFALALWDRSERRLHLARDRFGEKPLYYGWTRGGFVFGSELKALRRYPGFDNPVDRDVLALYASLQCVPAPHAIYRSTYKLEPGCVLSLSAPDAASPPSEAPRAPARHGSLTVERYWSLTDVALRGLADPIHDERQAVDELETALSSAVRRQSVADVPVGAFLSGGLDSSTIVALMQRQSTARVRTFTIGFDAPGFDEAGHARAVARHLGTDHAELHVSLKHALGVIPDLARVYCEPFADSSQIPTCLVAQMARRQVTVALSGDGGDEQFGGYNRYVWSRRLWASMSLLPRPLRRLAGAGLEAVPATAWDAIGGWLPVAGRLSLLGDKLHKLARVMRTAGSVDDIYLSLVSGHQYAPGARPLPTRLDDPAIVRDVGEPEHRMMLRDALTYLPDDILHKLDRAAMSVGLETRVPFLDTRVAELAWRLPLHMKIRDGRGKWALRQVLYRHLPRELFERPKAGFAVPVGQWLRGPLRHWAEDLLTRPALAEAGGFSRELVARKWRQHLAGSHDWTPALWSVLMFEAWLQDQRGC